MPTLKLFAALAAIAISSAFVARAAGPHTCGEYRYWKHGECHDARDANPGPWPDQMAKKSAW
jgi:hypothetical protein